MTYLWRFLSARYWLRHRGAFFLSTLGVALGLAVFVSVQVANYSVLASFSASLDAVAGKANLQIIGGDKGLPEEVFVGVKRLSDPRIRAAAPLLSKTLYSPTLNTSLLVMGIDLFSEAEFRDYGLEEEEGATGDADWLSQFLIDPNTIAISQSLAKRYNLKRGDKLTVYVGAQRRTFTVSTLLDTEAAGQAFGGDFALLDIAAAQEALSQLGHISQIDLIVDESQLDAVAASLRKIAPADAVVQRPAQRGQQVSDLLAAFQLNLTALSCIALFVGAFLIYNAIAIAVVRRRQEVGMLRAVGAARGQLMRMFLLEAALIGLVGSIAGFALGLALSQFTLRAVSTTVSALYIAVKARELVVPPWLWWGAPLGGTVLAVLAAVPSAWEAANTSPRVALQRITLHHATAHYAAPLAGVGIVFLGVALLLCQPFISGRALFAGFIAAFFTLSGFSLLTPLFTLWAGRMAQRAAGSVFGIEGTLAGSYLQRALNRSSLVIAALMVSLAMMIGLSVMVRSFRGTVVDWVDTSIKADLYIAPGRGFSGDLGPGLPAEVVQYATRLPSVRHYDTIRNLEIQLRNQPVLIAANELPTLATGERTIRFVETVGGNEAAKRAFLENRAVLVSERFKNLVGIGAGGTLQLTSPRGEVEFPVAGVFYDYSPDVAVVYVPRSLYVKYWNDRAIDGIALHFKEGVSTAAVKEDLERRFASRYQLTLLPNREIRESVFETFDQTFAVTYALQLIAIIVATIGIFDTLIALLLERSRELATLRAVGASAAQINKMTFIEFALIGFFAWIIGVAAGLCLAWQLIYVINRQFFGWTITWTLPFGVLLQALVLALVAAIGAGVLPARAAARRNIAESLQTE
jgi:putative ABC transport system permease protein